MNIRENTTNTESRHTEPLHSKGEASMPFTDSIKSKIYSHTNSLDEASTLPTQSRHTELLRSKSEVSNTNPQNLDSMDSIESKFTHHTERSKANISNSQNLDSTKPTESTPTFAIDSTESTPFAADSTITPTFAEDSIISPPLCGGGWGGDMERDIKGDTDMDMRGNITDNTTNTTPKTLITQFQILYKELSNYSPKLAAKPYAIAITKADISNKDMQSFGKFKLDSNFKDAKIYLSPTLHDFITHGITQPPPTQSKPTSNTSPLQSQVSNVKNSQNLDSIESKISSHDEPLESKASNIEKTQNLDSKTPLFIIQISSIAHKNLDALKSLLLSALKLQK